METKLLTVGETAVMLRTSPSTIRRWIKQGKLAGVKPSGARHYLVPKDQIETFLKPVEVVK